LTVLILRKYKEGLKMNLKYSGGARLTIEQMEKARELLGDCFERIIEINNGIYSKMDDAVQFDYVSSPELANLTDSLTDIIKKINKIVYQE
jgi:hypothetical protein